jgi:hypothetical protein
MRATSLNPSVYGGSGHHATAHGGMGDATSDWNSLFGSSQPSSVGGTVYTLPGSPTGVDELGGYTPGAITGSSGPVASTNWSSVLSGITNSFTSIFKAIQPIPAGCSQVLTAQGSSVQCLSSVQQQSGASFTSMLGSGSSSTILLLIGGVVLVMMMKR